MKRRLSTAFHPQTDGQTERQNQGLEQYLRTFASSEQANWAGLLPLAEFAYMNSEHSTLGISPFYCMYGYNPDINFEPEDRPIGEEIPAAKDRVKSLHEMRLTLADRWRRITESSQKAYNKKHDPKSYNVGDLVMLNTKNLKLKRPSKKLTPRFVGPFKINDKIGTQAYRLFLPTSYRIHPTVHVSLLEPYHARAGDEVAEAMMQAPELVDDEEEWVVEEIIDRVRSNKGVWYQVKWANWGPEYNQWVPEADMEHAQELREEYDGTARSKRRRR